MGAYTPSPFLTPYLKGKALEIIQKTLKGIRSQGHPFVGVLYLGLILTTDGLSVLEYNCRFGDPETQCLLPLLQTDLLEIMMVRIRISILFQIRLAALVVLIQLQLSGLKIILLALCFVQMGTH